MKTYKRICKKDFTMTDGELTLNLTKGTEYITSITKNMECTVFANVWAKVPSTLFRNRKVFTPS